MEWSDGESCSTATAMKPLCFVLLLTALVSPPAVAADTLSTSLLRPMPVEPNGVIRGPLPTAKTAYYFSIEAQAGELLTQLALRGTPGAEKQLALELLDPTARVQDSYWIHGADASSEATRSFAIDGRGRRLLRVIVQGPATGNFCVVLGGSALSTTGDQTCWDSTEQTDRPHSPAAVTTTDLRAAKIELVEAPCEQRLRIGSDVLFDFDQAAPRREATATLDPAVHYLQSFRHAVRVEGHTDGKGAAAYNQGLSEKRAESIRQYLVQHGVAAARVTSVGFGKTRPVAANTYPDGSDNPEGRQKNRRVEIVIDTCARPTGEAH
jgi:outer membrane protein OmpA-like peptidoglycan-associated protein